MILTLAQFSARDWFRLAVAVLAASLIAGALVVRYLRARQQHFGPVVVGATAVVLWAVILTIWLVLARA
jgi:hypothetical protein